MLCKCVGVVPFTKDGKTCFYCDLPLKKGVVITTNSIKESGA